MELGKVPNFEPDEEFKRMLEDLFAPKKEKQKEEAKESQKEISDKKFTEKTKKTPTRRVKLPEPPAQTKEQEKEAVKFAKAELDILFDAFYEFTEAAGETIVFGYLHNDIMELVNKFEDIDILLEEKIDKVKLTEYGLTDFEKFRKIRQRMLNDMFKRYKKGE